MQIFRVDLEDGRVGCRGAVDGAEGFQLREAEDFAVPFCGGVEVWYRDGDVVDRVKNLRVSCMSAEVPVLMLRCCSFGVIAYSSRSCFDHLECGSLCVYRL